MFDRPILLWCLCAAALALIFGMLYSVELYDVAVSGKSLIAMLGVFFTWLAASMEFGLLVRKHRTVPMTLEEAIAAGAKAFAALAIVATILGSAGDLGSKQKMMVELPTPR